MVLGVSAKEWAINMLKEETELDTLALIAIRNMLGVSFFLLLYLCFPGCSMRYPNCLFTCCVFVNVVYNGELSCTCAIRYHMCLQCTEIFCICYPKIVHRFQCVVAPGKRPVTETERALSTSSGHIIIHLMPGDNHYDPSSFCVVLAWNGLNHYTPTYLMKHSSILQHRCSVINRLLSTATELFSDIESDLDETKDEDLIDHFHNLRDQTIQATHLLTLKGLEHPILPKSVGGPDPNDVKSHLTRKTPLPVHPEPLISHALQHPLDPDSAVSHPTPYSLHPASPFLKGYQTGGL